MTAAGRYTGTISIIVPTVARDEHLVRLLRSIVTDPDRGAYEVFVGDQSPQDRREELLEGLDATHITWARLPKGKSRALNAGIRWANGEVIALLDDDVSLLSGWFDQLRRAAAGDPFEVVYGGVVAPRPIEPHEVLPRTKPEPIAVRGRVPGVRMMLGIGANVAGRTAIFRELGFDEGMGPGSPVGSGDDTEFAERAAMAGVHRRLIPEMAVAHHEIRSTRDGSAQRVLARYIQGRGGLCARHLRQRRWRAAAYDLRSIWAQSTPQGVRGVPYRLRRVLGFVRGVVIGLRLPYDPATGTFRPRHEPEHP